MFFKPALQGTSRAGVGGVTARTTAAFAAIGDHQRLPWRFFARLKASDGSLLRR
jgi:hypothetical protein